MEALNFSIDLPIRSDWANVDLLRTSVRNCFTAIFNDIEGGYSLAMVTGELVENAIKYGYWTGATGATGPTGPDEQRFRLRLWGEGRHVHVSVENPVHGGDVQVEEVLKTLRWMRGFSSPSDAYRAKLLEIAAADHDRSNSKLGLVRIAYEGNCMLTAELTRGVLRVQAEMTV
jgi:hypothetical protein